MVHSILVPLDGSQLSEQVIPYAQALAKATDAELVFMRAVLTVPLRFREAVTFNTDLRETANNYLERHVEATRKDGLKAQSQVWEDEAGSAIIQMVEGRHPDLIVMSTHGRGGLERVIWGSVTDHVLHHTNVPLLVVPRGTEVSWANVTRPHFLVPLDGSPLAEEALGTAEQLARAFNGEIDLVRAIEPNTWLIDDPWAISVYDQSMVDIERQQREQAGKYLDGLASALNAKGITASVTVVEGNAASVIRRVARDYQAHAVVMATHGRGGATRMLLGSVADSIVRSARLPVFIVRPAGARVPVAQPLTSETEERTLAIALSQPELRLIRAGLQHLANSSHDGKYLVDTFDLLDRLNQVEMAEHPVGAGR